MEKTDQYKPILIKTIFIGDSGVGKTSLMERQHNETFRKEHIATIGCDFRVKTYNVGQIAVKMQYWDTAGQQRFHSIQRPYYKGASAVILCFDLSKRQSFDNLPKWIDQINKQPGQFRQTFLVGCKSDLDAEVPTDQIIVFAEKQKMIYFQTSAKTGQGINETFNRIVTVSTQKYIERQIAQPQRVMPIKDKNSQVQKKRGCC